MIRALSIPNTEMAEFVALPAAIRQEITLWMDVCRVIEGAENKTAAIRDQANRLSHMRGGSEASVRRHYYEFRSANYNWRVFIDRAKLPKRHGGKMVERIYKYYCETNKASSLEAYNAMMRDLRNQKVLAPEGVTWRDIWRVDRPNRRMPDRCPQDYRPHGWSYRNLQERFGLSEYEKKAVRIGRGAAAEALPPVYTTRAGLKVMQVVQFDDMHHNTLVNFPGNSKAYAPLEFCAVDVFSGCRFEWGLRPVLEKDNGRTDQLKEHEFRFLYAKVLTEWGYRPEGTVHVVEHGTAAIREPLRKRIREWTDGAVVFKDSGILSEQVHKGLFPGAKRGNFKVKAVLESGHRLAQHMAAALPGYTGTNARTNRPEELAGREQYNKELVSIHQALMRRDPDRAAMLMMPVLNFESYHRAINELYDVMNWRTQHQLEGYRSAELTITEFRLAPDASDWMPWQALLRMEPAHRAAIEALVQSDPQQFCRTRLMAPQEVFNAGAQGLQKLSKWHVPELIGEAGALEITVTRQGLLRFDRREHGPEARVYWGTVTTPSNFQRDLSRNTTYLVHANLLSPNEIFVSDKDSGAVLGVAALYSAPTKTDELAIRELQGKQAHERAKLEAPIRDRHRADADAAEAMREHNRRVVDGVEPTAEEAIHKARLEQFDPDAGDEDAAFEWGDDDTEEADISADEISSILRDE